MNSGTPQMFQFNRNTNKMDYFGQVINRAARVMALSVDGETSLSDVCKARLDVNFQSKYIINTRGLHSLKGVEGQVELFSLMSPGLQNRARYVEERRGQLQDLMTPAMSPMTEE